MTATAAATPPASRARGPVGVASVRSTIERRLGLTTVGLVVLVLAAAVIGVGQQLPSRAMVLMGYILLLVIALAWMLGRRKLAIDATRAELPPRVTAGRTVESSVELTARRRVSSIVAEETLDAALGPAVRVGVPILPTGESMRHEYTFTPTRRGVYEVGPLFAEFSDPFGLTIRRQRIAEPTRLVVHPRTEPVTDRITSREWEDPPVRPPLSRPWPSGFEFYGMRDYVPGDDPRRIVWRSVAKFDRYVVKESEQGVTDRAQIWIDTDRSNHHAGVPSSTLETAVTAAASLGVKHLADGFGVTLDINSQRLVTGFRSLAKRIPLLDAFAPIEREDVPLEHALDRMLVDRQRRAHNILITPHLSADAAARLRLLLERGTAVLVVLVVWDDTDPFTLHRAGTLGTTVVEVRPGQPMATAFRQLVGGTRR